MFRRRIGVVVGGGGGGVVLKMALESLLKRTLFTQKKNSLLDDNKG
jgi:hypothetical protein